MLLGPRRPVVEETLQGIVARRLDHFPRSRHPALVRDLLGGANNSLSVDFPHRLLRLCPKLGISVEVAIKNNTLLPLFSPFVREEAVARAEVYMRHAKSPHFTLGVGPSGPCVSSRLRLCPICETADVAQYGVPLWRRLHQVAAIRVCPAHGVVLMETEVPARSVFQFTYQSGRAALGRDPVLTNPSLQPELLWIARAMQIITILPSCPRPGPDRLSDFYYEQLKPRGFVLQNGRVAHTELMHAFTSSLSAELLNELRCLPDVDARDNWVRRLMSGHPEHQPPYRHLLLLRFLRLEPIPALTAAMSASRILQTALLRPQFLEPDKRLRATKRVQWKKALRSGKTGLRESHNALYSWLWRHDRQYLLAHAPLKTNSTRSRRDWIKIDDDLLANLRLAATDLKKRGLRTSRTKLAVASGRPSLMMARHPMVPRALAALDVLAQDAESHAIFRISALLKIASYTGQRFKPWRLAQLAGIGAAMQQRPVIRHLLRSASVPNSL